MKPDGYCLKGPDGKVYRDAIYESEQEAMEQNFHSPDNGRAMGYSVVPVRVVEVEDA